MKSANYLTDKVSPQIGKSESPFISMSLSHRIWIVGAVVIYLLFIQIQGHLSPTPTVASGWVFLALTVNLALLLIPIIFYQPTYGWFHPLVFGFFINLLDHLRRTSTYIDGLQWHMALPGWSPESLTFLVAHGLAFSTVGLVAYYFGFFFSPTFGVPRVTFSQPRHLSRKIFLVVVFSTVAFLVYMQTRGGITAHVLSWGRGRRVELAGQFYWGFLVQFGLAACLIWLALDRKVHLQRRFWGCAGTLIAIKFLTAGSRSTVVYAIILGVLVWQLRERKIAAGKLLIVVALCLLLLGVLGSFRGSTYEEEVNWNALTEFSTSFGTAVTELGLRSGAGSGTYPILGLVPGQVNFLYGSTYFALLTLPIPKVLWDGKPGLVGGLVGDAFFQGTAGGVPPGAMGEAYWNFGILGVLIVFFLFGAFHKWLAEAFRKYASEPATIVPYVITVFLCDPSGLGVTVWLESLVPVIILLYIFKAITFKRRGQVKM